MSIGQSPEVELVHAAAPTGARGWPEWAWGLLAALIGILVFSPSINNDFVFDDVAYVRENPWIRSWSNWQECLITVKANSMGGGREGDPVYPTWRPLRLIAHTLDYSIAGMSAPWFRFVNFLWHGLAVQALFLLLRRMGVPLRAAFVAALVFAVHPAQHESVIYIKEREGLMAGAFALLAWRAALGRGAFSAAAALVLFALAMLTKESAAPWPLALVGIAYAHHVATRREGGFARRTAILFAGGIAIVAAYLLARRAVMGSTAQMEGWIGGTFLVTMWTMCEVFLRYVGIVLLPLKLEMRYAHIRPATPMDPMAIGGALLLILAIAVLFMAWRANRGGKRSTTWAFAGAGVLLFVASLGPVSNLIPMLQWMAVRFLYLPMTGAALLFGIVFDRLHEGAESRGLRFGGRLAYAPIAAVVLLLFFSYLSVLKTFAWRNEGTLWTDAYLTNPSARTVKAAYAHAMLRAGNPQEALKALDDYPWSPVASHDDSAWIAKAEALEAIGDRAGALATIERARALLPELRRLHPARAGLYERAGNLDLALEAWGDCLEGDPYNELALQRRVAILRALGRGQEAKTDLQLLERMRTLPRSQWGIR